MQRFPTLLTTAALMLAALVGVLAATPTASAYCTVTPGGGLAFDCAGHTGRVGTCHGVGAGYSIDGTLQSAFCVHECASSGIGGLGVTYTSMGTTEPCMSVNGPPTVTSCALYRDMTVPGTPVMYPGSTGIVLDYPASGYTGADGDVAVCVKQCPAATPYGIVLNNGPICSGTPTLCSPPGPGWTVGANGTCVGAPWVVAGPTLACPSGEVTIVYGTTPVVGGTPPWTIVCL